MFKVYSYLPLYVTKQGVAVVQAAAEHAFAYYGCRDFNPCKVKRMEQPDFSLVVNSDLCYLSPLRDYCNAGSHVIIRTGRLLNSCNLKTSEIFE